MKDVLFVTVQYNNPADTESFLKSLGRVDRASECDVVVVDNSSEVDAATDHRVLSVADALDVRLIRPPRNLYYWGGAAFALESLFGASGAWPRWIVICNNDLTIDDPQFLRLLHELDSSEYAIVAPKIISQATGKDQNPILETFPGPFKRAKWRMYDVSYVIAKSLLGLHETLRLAAKPFRRQGTGADASTTPRQIYAPHGACMIFSSAFFERGGSLDTKVPLFAEELTIAAQAEALGLPIWYCPSLRVSHREHSTTGSRLTRAKYEMERQARRRYYEYGNEARHRALNGDKAR